MNELNDSQRSDSQPAAGAPSATVDEEEQEVCHRVREKREKREKREENRGEKKKRKADECDESASVLSFENDG